MSDREEILRSKTYKDDVEEVNQRVFYTIHDGKELELHRSVKMLSLLIDHLAKKGLLDEKTLDEMLLKVAL